MPHPAPRPPGQGTGREPGAASQADQDAGAPSRRHQDPGQQQSAPASQPAQAKLDQIKDLYLTAEAIGEDALVKHFDEVSRRQRELIREYFEQSGFKSSAGSSRAPWEMPASDPGPDPMSDEAHLRG
ncbi:MAG TPA: hypothetical protein VH637_09840 [Streptosporangiaceae bacterium]|jgi:hypothetical protein